jgi:KaiC/GvpD/RAD55 family RecA-like ATPase/predicted RNA-binding protein with TRAM domain
LRWRELKRRASKRRIALILETIVVLYAVTLAPANAHTRVGAFTLKPGESFLASAAIDATRQFAYFGTDTKPGIIIQVGLSNFTRAGAFTLRTGENGLRSAVIDASSGFAYFGTDTSPGIVVKVRLSDFTLAGALTLRPGEDNLTSAVIDPSHGFAYFGTDTQPGIVVKIRLSDFSQEGALMLNPREGGLVSAVIDSTNGFAYFGTDSSPGVVVKIDLSNFTRSDTITLNPGENSLRIAIVDTTRGFAYFGTDTDPGIVIKIRLLDFTRVDTLTLNLGEGGLSAGVLDTPSDSIYFGADTASAGANVIRVSVSNFTRINTITLTSEESLLRCAVIDPTTGFVYFGTYTDPGNVVKVNVRATTPVTSSSTVVTSNLSYSTSSGSSLSILGISPEPLVGAAGAILVGVVASLVIMKRRRGPPGSTVLKTSVPTGYADLDQVLPGGVPTGHSVLFVSPPYDERDLLLRKMAGSCVSSGLQVCYVSNDTGRVQDMVNRFRKNFYAFSSETSRISPTSENLYEVPGIGNLVEFNIVLNKNISEHMKDAKNRLMIFDTLSDILLRHRGVLTRKWLSDFLGRRKAQGFTVLATLDPLVTGREESDRIVDLFDGVIDIYEKQEPEGRSARFLAVRKMYGQKYTQTELKLDLDRLF